MKTSSGKKMYPGRKQVFREENGDTVGVFGEELPGEPLLEKVMESGQPVKRLPTLKESREYFLERFSKLPDELKRIDRKVEYPVRISEKLRELYRKTLSEIERES